MHTWHRTMDDTDVTNEKSAEFEDGIGDPDLEARLYAEIYFSNETYEDNEGAEQSVSKTSGRGENVTPLLSRETPVANVTNFDINTVSINEGSRPITGDFFYDYGRPDIPRPGTKGDCGQANCRVENTTVTDTRPCNTTNTERSNAARTFLKQQRLLARKDLWLPRETSNEQTRELTGPANVPSKNLRTKTKGVPNKNKESTGYIREQAINQIHKAAETKQTEKVSGVNICTTDKPGPSKKKKEKKKKKNKNPVGKESCGSTKEKKRCKDLLNDSGVSTETSKYSIISKRMKLNIKNAKCDTLSISSDSDDSILEVPIPPKAQPPLIELPDSDEDCDTNSVARKKKRSRSVERDKKRDEKARNAERVTCEYDGPSTSHKDAVCPNEISEKSPNVESPYAQNSETIDDNSTDLILNCSDPRRDALNLGGNRIGRTEMFNANCITENETNHRRMPPGVESDTAETSDTFHVDRSFSTASPRNREPTIDDSTGGTTNVGLNETNISGTDNRATQNEKTKRKRQKAADSKSSKENNISGTPEKKRKRNATPSSGNNSMTDYFFKPMTNEMKAFYNGPCGSENMDVHDIQSRMPSHPSNWKILHIDLLPVTKKRGRVCPRCRNDTHHGKRCPEPASVPSCCMCGAKGHVETRCPQTMCLTCGRKYTSFRPICCHCSKLSCDICHGVGHTRQNCPDLWRRFHSTTTETLPAPKNISNTMKDPQHLSCCNCAKRGHDAAMCSQLRWSQHFPTPRYVSSYTEGPFYPEFQHERIQDENISGNIEVVDVPDNNDSNVIPSTNERFEPCSIFKCGNLDPEKSTTFTVISKRLDTLPNVHLDGLLAGDFMPGFLLKWQKYFTFNVNITQSSEEGIRLVIEADCPHLLHGIEKNLMQWITRSDLEKPYLRYGDLPFGNYKRLTLQLKQKLCELDNVREPAKILARIVAIARTLQNTSAKELQKQGSLRSATTNPSKFRRKKEIQKSFDNLMKERSRLVMSLYGRSWVEGGEITVRQYRKLVAEISSCQRFNITREYIQVVYLYNELFTYHESDALTRALEAVTLTAGPMESLIPALPQDSITMSGSNCPRTFSENSSNHIIHDNNSQPVPASPVIANTSAERWSMSGNCATTECSQMSSLPFSPEIIQSQNSFNTLLLNPCRRSKRDCTRKVDNVLLSDLPKRQRKLSRRAAKRVMRLARESEKPTLCQMANVLQFKLENNSIRTSDIKMLKRIVKTLNAQPTPTKRGKRRKSETNAS